MECTRKPDCSCELETHSLLGAFEGDWVDLFHGDSSELLDEQLTREAFDICDVLCLPVEEGMIERGTGLQGHFRAWPH